ncbi:MAG: efflux RND transporter periplasmic adaptor subunit [Acidobacteria bacterium]|nr:efflux RND transporter periplasmic adaptor subunit [Acidobacteriota bacterium]
MKPKVRLTLLIVGVFLLGSALPAFIIWNPAGWHWADRLIGRHAAGAGEGQTTVKQLWTCSMHPQVIQDKPGNCPICGMRLVPVKDAGSPASQAGQAKGERKIKYWRAPMDPNYISDKPGKSPMGMDLIPVYEDEQSVESGIRVDPGFLQNFSVRTVRAEKGSIPVETRTVGTLTYNEKNIASVNTKFEGWIEKVNVNYVGEPVSKGQVLFEIYSPQLVTTQQEYLASLQYLEKLKAGGNPEAIDRAAALVQASWERLRYWDITEGQIDALKQSGKLTRTLKILSPASGVVVAKMDNALEGMKLSPGMNVYKIADLSTVWAQIEVYEYQVQYLRLGQSARITIDAFPGRTWSGKVIYLGPSLNQQTRTLKAYVEIANPDSKLRPEMYANIELSTPAVAGAVKVPSEAILHTGDRSVVIVAKSKGVFEPREVQLGAIGGGYQEVRQGLRAGETVVTSSQFLIDSESNLKEAISKMLGERKGEGEQKQPPAPAPAHQH